MTKKGRSRKKPHIKQKEFLDRNISSLESHLRDGKTIRTRWSTLPGTVRWHSWHDECIPNILWACILASQLDRETYLEHFRQVVIAARTNLATHKERFITHNYLSLLTNDEFDTVFSHVFKDPKATQALSALKAIDCLPDRAHWERRLGELNSEDAGQILAKAVSETFDHQSEKSTDIRWMKMMYSLVVGKLIMPDTMAERVEEYREYPNRGDMRSVRPSIRSLEMTLRPFEIGEEPPNGVTLPPSHVEGFWQEMKTKTACIVVAEFEPPTKGRQQFTKEVSSVFHELQNHFDATIATTAPDPKHDGTFGLGLYALSLLLNSSLSYGHGVLEGRIVLRSIVEVFITLEFLASKDDASLWQQYRRFGAGQAKLAFLKNVREADVPAFVDLTLIESLANEDMWMEFEDVQLGNWANLNLRKMADEANVKDVYDKFYDWASGYSHAHWISVRNAVFVNCMNPLHRFHRIPGPPIVNMPSILVDAAGLINRMLDTISRLFPTFKPRIRSHKEPGSDDTQADEKQSEDKLRDQVQPPTEGTK